VPKLLLAGAWQYDFYEAACADALTRLGVQVVPFKWQRFFGGIAGRAEGKYVFRGPATLAMNRALRNLAGNERPDFVLVWRGTHVLPETVRAIREQTGAVTASYNNDDPFGPLYARSASFHLKRLWRIFKAAIPEYDVQFVYRECNLDEFIRAGAKRALVLRSYFIPALHRPVALTPEEQARFGCDAVFVGHYEPERLDFIRALVAAGLKVRIHGRASSWTPERLGDLAAYFGEIHPALGDDYVKALGGAKMCLCFFSRLNRDTYTRRSFEIPACGGLLLSEQTPEMQSLFAEDEEAVYFSTPQELIEKATALLRDSNRRDATAAAGRRRCIEDGHSVDARMAWILERLAEIA
jgi:spore maturation protein CgeB